MTLPTSLMISHFRSSNAAASLKRYLKLRKRPSESVFPQQQCCGLIEAEACAAWSVGSAVFPQQQCCGLIEALTAPAIMRNLSDFRSSNAAASLKPLFSVAV